MREGRVAQARTPRAVVLQARVLMGHDPLTLREARLFELGKQVGREEGRALKPWVPPTPRVTEQVLALLRERPRTSAELATVMEGVPIKSVRSRLSELHGRGRVVMVSQLDGIRRAVWGVRYDAG